MKIFEIEIDDLEAGPIELELAPSESELEALFEPFDEDFEVLTDEPFTIDVWAQLDGDTVLLTGTISGGFGYTCGRCLETRETEVDTDLNFTVLSQREWEERYEGTDEVVLDEQDLDADFYEGYSVDLAPLIREAVMMELPQWPQCPTELREECDEAFESHVGQETLDTMEEQSVDLRWWPLRDIELSDDESEQN